MQQGCPFAPPNETPPRDALPLTEDEAMRHVGVLNDGPRCVPPRERWRIAHDPGALTLYAELLTGQRDRRDFDRTAALEWLASSADPRPYLPIFLSAATVDTSRLGLGFLVNHPAAYGLLRLAPTVPAARERLTEISRRGAWEQRWFLARILVHVNDSAARAILREDGAALAAGPPAHYRLPRAIAAVLAAPPPSMMETGPCHDGRQLGRTSSGAYGCVLPVPGARLVAQSGRRIAEFNRGQRSERRGREGLRISASGPAFLGRDAGVDISLSTGAHNVAASLSPDTVLRALETTTGEVLTPSTLRNAIVIRTLAEIDGRGGGSLRIARSGNGRSRFHVDVASPGLPPSEPMRVGTLELSEKDTAHLLRVLHEAASAASELQAAGTERIVGRNEVRRRER